MLPVLTIRQTAVRTMRHERASHITPHTNVTHLWRQSFSRCGNHRSVHPTHSTIRHQQQNAHTSLAAPRHPRASTQSNADSDHSYLHPIVTSNGMPHRERRYAGGRPCGRPPAYPINTVHVLPDDSSQRFSSASPGPDWPVPYSLVVTSTLGGQPCGRPEAT